MRFGIFYEHQNPRPWAGERSEHTAAQGRARAGRAGGPGRLRLRLGGRAPLPRGVLALSAPEVFLAAAAAAHRAHPARARNRPDPARGEPSGARGRARRHARPDLRRPPRVRHRRVELGGRAGRLPRRSHAEARDVGGRDRRDRAHVRGGAVRRLGQRVLPHAPAQRRAEAAAAARTRRCGWPAAAARRSSSPPATGSGRCRSRSSSPRTPASGSTSTTSCIESEECVPAGFAVNPNVAVVLPMMVHEDEATAIERGIDGAHFFGYSLAHYYGMGTTSPAARTSGRSSSRTATPRGFARHLVTPDAAPLAVKIMQDGPRLAARRDRLARPGADLLPPLRGRGCRSGDLRAAGRPEHARAHLR